MCSSSCPMNTMETARQKRDLQEWLPVPSFQGPQSPQEPEAVLLPAVLPVREAVLLPAVLPVGEAVHQVIHQAVHPEVFQKKALGEEKT